MLRRGAQAVRPPPPGPGRRMHRCSSAPPCRHPWVHTAAPKGVGGANRPPQVRRDQAPRGAGSYPGFLQRRALRWHGRRWPVVSSAAPARNNYPPCSLKQTTNANCLLNWPGTSPAAVPAGRSEGEALAAPAEGGTPPRQVAPPLIYLPSFLWGVRGAGRKSGRWDKVLCSDFQVL